MINANYLGVTANQLAEVASMLEADNANLRERITTQKQTIQAYRDESREWWEIAVARGQTIDRMGADNARLRELVRDVWHLFTEHGAVHPCDLPVVDAVRDRMHELGVEVDG